MADVCLFCVQQSEEGAGCTWFRQRQVSVGSGEARWLNSGATGAGGKWEREQWAPEQITLLWYRGGETKGWEMSPTQKGHGEKPKRHKDRLFVPAIRGRKICRQFCRRNGNRRRGSQLIWVIRSCVTFAFWCVRAVWLCRQARPAPTKKTERGRGDLYFVCTSHIFAVA